MKITKPLNNNVVMSHDDKLDEEVVIVGTGVGFHAKKGDLVDESKIQKIFMVSKNKKLVELIEQIPASYLEITEKLFEYAKTKYDIQLNDDIYLLLTDHIYYALQRIQEGVELDNPFLVDIKQFYIKEYQIALYAKDLIYDMYQVDIPDEEVGYISLHMIASEYQQDKRDFNKIFEVVEISVEHIKAHYLMKIDEKSLAYTRLLNHVKFFAKRYVENKENQKQDKLLDNVIQDVFLEEYECINALSNVLKDKYGRSISDSEKNYLVLHLRNCKDVLK